MRRRISAYALALLLAVSAFVAARAHSQQPRRRKTFAIDDPYEAHPHPHRP
jgi:hypothetical protein